MSKAIDRRTNGKGDMSEQTEENDEKVGVGHG